MQYEEVLRKAQNIGNNSSAVMEMLFVATIWFLIITTIFSIGQFYLERHYARGSARQLPLTPVQRVRQLVFKFQRGTVASGSGSGKGGAA